MHGLVAVGGRAQWADESVVVQVLVPPVGPSVKDSVVQTTTQPLDKTKPRAAIAPGVAATYISNLWMHHHVVMKTQRYEIYLAATPGAIAARGLILTSGWVVVWTTESFTLGSTVINENVNTL
ncbi:hypothetical protein AC1031_001403 [Aphanomyces cochlioides]|nr:hypothetical protein AC1031_001403 [Aphanomyces cochlioides]